MGVLAALLVGFGLALLVAGYLRRSQERDDQLRDLLDLPYGEEEADAAVISRTAALELGVGAVGSLLDRMDLSGRLAAALEAGNVPLRPAELVLASVGGGLAVGTWLAALSGQIVLGLFPLVVAPTVGLALVRRRAAKRRAAIEDQLPGTLSMIASSLRAGHSFLRAVQLLADDQRPPMSDELQRVVAETQLGVPVVDSLDNLARRLDIEDLTWAVRAVRIQQDVGGKLADLLTTLADYLRARQEVHREVQVLTAEGRMSAWVLAGLPVFVGLALQALNPTYLSELFRFPGILLLVGAGTLMTLGVVMILRMAKVDL